MTDRSNGYEGVAVEFLAGRGSARSKGIGVTPVREWARTLPPGAAVIDLGCGPGFPITEVLVAEGLNVHAIDASPSFVEALRHNLPGIPIACEAVEDSLGAPEYRRQLMTVGLSVIREYEDEGENHYFDSVKTAEASTHKKIMLDEHAPEK